MPGPSLPGRCDVLVAGGGVAGVAAAVSAARAGASVVLAERAGSLGGIGVRGMLRTLCGLYGSGGELLNGGIAADVAAALAKKAPLRRPVRMGKVTVLPYDSADLAAVLTELCSAEPSIVPAMMTAVVDAHCESGRVTSVTLECDGKREQVQAGSFVDCTGDGAAAVLAGASYDLAPENERQLAGFVVHVRGLIDADEGLALKVPYVLAAALKRGELAPASRFTTMTFGDGRSECFLKFSIGLPGTEEDARDETTRALTVLTKELPAFRDASVAGSSGVLEREGRRIRGEYVLTEQDVLSGRKFDDAAARNAWPVELWDPQQGTVLRFLPDGEHYDIPLRCLRAKGYGNLFVAGRCMSADRGAQASARVMGACLATGDAAGRAAAKVAKER